MVVRFTVVLARELESSIWSRIGKTLLDMYVMKFKKLLLAKQSNRRKEMRENGEVGLPNYISFISKRIPSKSNKSIVGKISGIINRIIKVLKFKS